MSAYGTAHSPALELKGQINPQVLLPVQNQLRVLQKTLLM
jgi:hypothetical protein